MMRMTRASIINVLSSPFVEMAELKGVPRRAIIFRHALPNALSPIINVVVLNLAYLVVGVIVVEVVFVYPGMGQLMVDGVDQARRAAGPGLRADLRGHLRRPQPARRHPLDPRQPPAAAPPLGRWREATAHRLSLDARRPPTAAPAARGGRRGAACRSASGSA